MESEIFDRETILDLMVNFIPLGIILFFIGTFAIFAPWGFELMPSGQMFAIMGIMFVALLILTYISAKAIEGDEKRATVYAQGQAGLEGAKPLHELEDKAEVDGAETSPEADGMQAEMAEDDGAAHVDGDADEPVATDTAAEADATDTEAEPEPASQTNATETDTETATEADKTDTEINTDESTKTE